MSNQTKASSLAAESHNQTVPPHPNMLWIPGGTFTMGSENFYAEEAPTHQAAVTGFWMDRYPVTNKEFERFVKATGYVTVAERPVNPDDYPGADLTALVPGSLVFHKTQGQVNLNDYRNWWRYIPGANWRRPYGRRSSIKKLGRHPVVHIAYEDAEAYANWTGKSLPTEAQWEFAARGGLEGADYVWGDEFMPGGKPMANTWQGEFPWQNLLEDAYEWTAPVGTFPANGYGLHEMTGNVWEWTADWYWEKDKEPSETKKACCVPTNPRGGKAEESYDPAQPHIRIPRKVIKGGSFLCAPNYCKRYRPAARSPEMIDSAACHLGFRCILNVGEE